MSIAKFTTTRFTTRMDKKDQNSLVPIELVYQIKGKRSYHHLKNKVRIENWDPKEQRAIFYSTKAAKESFPNLDPDILLSKEKVNTINHEILSIETGISKIESEFFLEGKIPGGEGADEYGPKDVINKLSGKPIKQAPIKNTTILITDFIEKFKENKEKVEKKAEERSLNVYDNVKRYLTNFKGKNLTFEDIDKDFISKFSDHMTTVEKINNITAERTYTAFKSILDYAREEGIPILTNYKKALHDTKELEVIALNFDQLKKIFYLDLSDDKVMENVRDAFIMSCVTGLRWSDLKALDWINIREDEGIISINVKKTKGIKALEIPLNNYSRHILKKNAGNDKPLTMYSSAYTNLYLKKIGKKAELTGPVTITRFYGITPVSKRYLLYQRLTSHVGRKTYFTVSRDKGMPLEDVMAITGHVSVANARRYDLVKKERLIKVASVWNDKIIKPKQKTTSYKKIKSIP